MQALQVAEIGIVRNDNVIVNSLAFVPNRPNALALLGPGRVSGLFTLRVIDTISEAVLARITCDQSFAFAIDPSGNKIACRGNSEQLMIWEPAIGLGDRQNNTRVVGSVGPLNSLAWSPDGKFFSIFSIHRHFYC